MNVGMLWYNSDSKMSLEEKVKGAAEYYKNKYGIDPDTCYVHPSMLGESGSTIRNIQIKTSKSVLPMHFWIGSS